MLVSKFIEELQKYPQDSHVAYTFETVVCEIEPDDMFMSKDGVLLIGDDYAEDFQDGTMSAKEEGGVKNELKPPLSLLAKLGSIAVHVDELLSLGGHDFDRHAIQSLLDDPEVKEWISKMIVWLPVKRSA